MCSCVSKRKVDVCRVALIDLVSNLDINETDSEETDGCESEAECLGWGIVYGSLDDSEKCDVCGVWWDLSCVCIEEESIAETRFCLW